MTVETPTPAPAKPSKGFLINSTIARITSRSLIGRRRFLLLLPLPLLLIGLAALADGLGARPDEWATPVLVGLGFAVVLPVIALIVGTGVLGAEIDDNTLVYVLATPQPRQRIVLTKLLVAIAVTVLTAGPGLFLAGLITGSVRLAAGLAVGGAVGAVVYSALFVVLSLLTRRPVLIGLAYLLIWEGTLTNLLSGTRVLSIQQYALSVGDAVAHSSLVTATVSTPVALIMSAVVTVGATWLAIDRLRSFSVAGETS